MLKGDKAFDKGLKTLKNGRHLRMATQWRRIALEQVRKDERRKSHAVRCAHSGLLLRSVASCGAMETAGGS